MITPTDQDDTAALNSALAGGETELGPGVFLVSNTILIPENAHVQGAGIGRTVLKMVPAVPGGQTGEVVRVSSGSSISGITTNSQDAICNGIIAYGATGVLVSKCEVLHRSDHCYGIWSYNSSKVEIADCLVNGGTFENDNSIPQEGIEVYKSTAVSVHGCQVQNCGRSAINLFTADEGDLNHDITVYGNTVWSSSFGLYAVAAKGSTLSAIKFIRNKVFPCGVSDLKLTTAPGAKLFATLQENDVNSMQFDTDQSATTHVTIN